MIINPYRFSSGSGPSPLQAKFVSWIEAINPTIDQVTSAALGGTATIAPIGDLTAAWNNGTVTGHAIPAMDAFSMVLSCRRPTTGTGAGFWCNDNGTTSGTNFTFYHFNGAFWLIRVGGAGPGNIGSFATATTLRIVWTRAAGSDSIDEYLDGAFNRTISGVFGTGAITGASLTSQMPSSSYLAVCGIADSVLNSSEIASLYSGGATKAWADI